MIISYRFSEVNTGHCRVFIFKNVQGWTEAGPGAETVPESLSSSSPLEALRSELIYSQLSKGVGMLQRRLSLGLQRGKQTRVNSSFIQTLIHL